LGCVLDAEALLQVVADGSRVGLKLFG
jgi:hypothetical protein